MDNVLLPTQSDPASSQLPTSDWATTPAQGAGLQLAIWDITVDNGDGFSAGAVQASQNPNNLTPTDVLDWAELYESLSLGESSDFAYVYDNTDGNGNNVQWLEGPEFADGPTPVPEPSTLVLLAAGLLSLKVGRSFRPPSTGKSFRRIRDEVQGGKRQIHRHRLGIVAERDHKPLGSFQTRRGRERNVNFPFPVFSRVETD